jgi:hypothetical protein
MARGTGLDAHRQDRRHQTSGTRAERLTPAPGGWVIRAGLSNPRMDCARLRRFCSFAASSFLFAGARVGPSGGRSYGVSVIGFSGCDPRTTRTPGPENALQEGASFFPLVRSSIRRTPGHRDADNRTPPVSGAVPACDYDGVPSATGIMQRVPVRRARFWLMQPSKTGRVSYQLCTRSDI